MATTRRGGRPWRRLVTFVLERDTPPGWTSPRCGLCGHPGADTGGHRTALEDDGVELDPDNVEAQHGRRHTLERDGFDCPGNYAHTTGTGSRWIPPPPSRPW